MAWNDPFANLVEKTVDELGSFLQEKGELAIHEIARTQEVCRDFCNFLCKDIHKATKKDYTVYLQLHAITPEDEDAYAIMLSSIREYCEKTMPNGAEVEQPTQLPPRKRAATNNMSLSEQELRDMFTMAETQMAPEEENVKQRKTTNTCTLSESTLRGLFIESQPQDSLTSPRISTSSSSANIKSVPRSGSGLINLGSGSVPHLSSGLIAAGQNAPTSQSLSHEDMKNASKSTPQNPQKAITPLPGKSGLYVNKDEFSLNALEEQLMIESSSLSASKRNTRSGLIRNNQTSKSCENLQAASSRGSYSGLLSIGTEDDSLNPGMFSDPNVSALPINQIDKALEEPQKIDLTRDVKGVEYDFSSSSIQKMRDFEKKKKLSEVEAMHNNPIDESLVGSFRPYLMDAKYLIDMPLPDANAMKAYKAPFITRILFPCAPAAILIALAVFLLSFNGFISFLGYLFIILALLAIIVALPDVAPAQQQTPQATLSAYIRCKNGRCYSKAESLLAIPATEDDNAFNFKEIWAPEQSWPKSLIARLDTPKVPELKNVTGTDIQNAHLFIHADGNEYWLLPMIRIGDKWYITDPRMTPHEAKQS